jgi:hypothetical protein
MDHRILEAIVHMLTHTSCPITVWGKEDPSASPMEDVSALATVFDRHDEICGFQMWAPPPGGLRGYFDVKDILALNAKENEIWVTVRHIQNRRD